MTAQPRRSFQRFLRSTLPAVLAGTLTIGGAAALAAPAKSKKVQPVSAGKSIGTTSAAAKKQRVSKGRTTAKGGAVLQTGSASWYGPGFHGRKTASGEAFDMYELTAAHKTLPLGTRVMVRNPANGKEVVVRINDRGPYAHGRILDLSKAAASQLGLISRGHGDVVLQALGDDDGSGASGLTSRLASADVDDAQASPSRSQRAQVLAQTRFGDSTQALGSPLPSDEPLPSWPTQDARTGLPIMTPPLGLAAAGGPRTGLNNPSWLNASEAAPQLAWVPEADAVQTLASGEASAMPLPGVLPQVSAQADAVAAADARPALPRGRAVPESLMVRVRHVPSAIAAGDVALSGDPSLRLTAPLMPAGGTAGDAANASAGALSGPGVSPPASLLPANAAATATMAGVPAP